MTDTVLPCPFCGHVGLDFKLGSTFRWLHVECANCEASCGEVRIQTMGEGGTDSWMLDAKAEAIKEWNTRAPKTTPAPPVATAVRLDCTAIRREHGLSYPRTCKRCGLGPCTRTLEQE